MKRVYLVKNHRSVWGVLIVLIGYGSNGNRYSEWKRLEWIAYYSITNINLQRQLLAVYQFWAILSLGKKESVIVSAVILAHASGKQKKSKQCQSSKGSQGFSGPLMQPQLAEWLKYREGLLSRLVVMTFWVGLAVWPGKEKIWSEDETV